MLVARCSAIAHVLAFGVKVKEKGMAITCTSCGATNKAGAKFCAQCRTPIMAAGVGFPGMDAPVAPAGGNGGNFLPTMPESENTSAAAQGPQFGGAAASTVHEAGHPGVAQPPPMGAAGRTIIHEEVSNPLAGWFVVLRSRNVQLYQDIPIFEGRNKIGRDPALGPQYLAEPNASSEHAMIIAEAGQVEIMDLGSSNGTVVNNKPVPRSAVLENGDMVRMGKTTMVFIQMPQSAV